MGIKVTFLERAASEFNPLSKHLYNWSGCSPVTHSLLGNVQAYKCSQSSYLNYPQLVLIKINCFLIRGIGFQWLGGGCLNFLLPMAQYRYFKKQTYRFIADISTFLWDTLYMHNAYIYYTQSVLKARLALSFIINCTEYYANYYALIIGKGL